MSKVIESPVDAFPGTVTLYDPLSFPMIIKIEETIAEAQQYRTYYYFCGKCKHEVELLEIVKPCPKCEGTIMQRINWDKSGSVSEYHNALAPAVMACVKSWELEGVGNPPEYFPGSPIVPANKLLVWIYDEIMHLYSGTGAVPNE